MPVGKTNRRANFTCTYELRRKATMRAVSVSVTVFFAVFIFDASVSSQAQQRAMSFFVTSVGLGKGGDLGGLEGADRHCQTLAQAVGAGNKTWHAYLSTQGSGGINAKDRIGNGPWFNAKGVEIAANVADLHSDNNKINTENGLTERGQKVPGVGYVFNMHDIMTGSQPDGRAFPGNMNLTCNNYASSEFGKVEVGHVDRTGLADTAQAHSWNSSHQSRDCSQEGLISTGGNGLLYCFAQ